MDIHLGEIARDHEEGRRFETYGDRLPPFNTAPDDYPVDWGPDRAAIQVKPDECERRILTRESGPGIGQFRFGLVPPCPAGRDDVLVCLGDGLGFAHIGRGGCAGGLRIHERHLRGRATGGQLRSSR